MKAVGLLLTPMAWTKEMRQLILESGRPIVDTYGMEKEMRQLILESGRPIVDTYGMEKAKEMRATNT